MFWRTGCIGCGPTCGGRRRRSEPERAGGEQADARAGVLQRRRLAGKAAVEAVGVAAGALAVGLPRRWSCARGLFPCGGGSSDFASTRAHGTEADPGSAGQLHPASLAGPAKQPDLPQRRSQQPRLLFPSGEVWGCRCRSWPLSVSARGRAPTPHAPETRPWAHGARCRLATAVRRIPRGPHSSRGGGQRRQRLPRTDAGPRHRPPQQRRPQTSGGGGPAVAAAVPALGAPGPGPGTARTSPRRGNKSNGFPQSVLGVFFSREGCGGPLLLLPRRASCLCAGDTG